jgi:hypothetical protein
MSMRMIVTAALLSAAMIGSAVAADDTVPWGDGSVAGWDIAIDQTLGCGCYILASFDGDTIVRIGFDPSNSDYYLMLADADWKSIEADKEYDLTLTMGHRQPWDATATGMMMGDQPTLMVRSTDTDFLDEFSSQQSIKVEYSGDQIANLNLTGSAAAIREMITCQDTVNQASKGSGDPFKKTAADPFAN